MRERIKSFERRRTFEDEVKWKNEQEYSRTEVHYKELIEKSLEEVIEAKAKEMELAAKEAEEKYMATGNMPNDFNPSHCQVGTFITLNNHHNKQTMMTKDEHTEEIELNQIKLERSEERKPPGDLVGPKTEPADTPFETPAPTSPLRPIKAEDHYLRRQLSQSHRAISEDISLLMAEGDKLWKSLKCCTTIILIILTAILLLVILRWVLYE